jgi:hypothetical protein
MFIAILEILKRIWCQSITKREKISSNCEKAKCNKEIFRKIYYMTVNLRLLRFLINTKVLSLHFQYVRHIWRTIKALCNF